MAACLLFGDKSFVVMENVAAVLHGPCEVKIVSNHYLSKLLLCRHSSPLEVTVIGICVQVQYSFIQCMNFIVTHWSECIHLLSYKPVCLTVLLLSSCH